MSILVVDPVYNPNSVTTITSGAKLEKELLSKFLGTYGDRTQI